MIKIFRGGGVVVGEGGSSEACLKWGGEGSVRDLSKNILKQEVGKGKSCSQEGRGFEGVTTLPPPPGKFNHTLSLSCRNLPTTSPLLSN